MNRRIYIIVIAMAGLSCLAMRWPGDPSSTNTGITPGVVHPVSLETMPVPEDETEAAVGEDPSSLMESAVDDVSSGEEPAEKEPSNEISPNEAPEDTALGKSAYEASPAVNPFAVTVLDATSIVVTNLAELSDALSFNNGYVNIYLGADIDITSGITIHTSKKAVLIDGVNPHDPDGTVHTVSDYANDLAGTVGIRSNSGTKSLTIRNMNILGKNYYGTFAVSTIAVGVTLTYDNVTYLGPQLTYNRGGHVRYCNGCDITIDNTPGSNERGEVAECVSVEFEGRVVINHTSKNNSTFWLIGPGSYIRLLPGSDVSLYSENREVFYVDYGPVDIILGEGATLNINTLYGVAYRGDGHKIGTLSLEENAGFYLTKRGLAATEPALRLQGSITTAPGARFQVFAPFSSTIPLILFTTNGTGAVFNDPDSVILYNGGAAPPFKWSTGSGYVNLYAQDVSYWSSAASLSVAGGLGDPPEYRWQKPAGNLLSIEATLNTSTAITSLNTNYTAEDGPNPPSAGTFSLLKARVLAFGRLPLALGKIMEGASNVVGTTKPDASIQIRYRVNESNRMISSAAHESGLFQIGIPDLLPAGTIVEATVNRDFLTRTDSTEVYALEGNLRFLLLPENLTFQTTTLQPEIGIIQRKGADFAIIVGDSRPQGGHWRLTVSVLQPMTTIHGHILHDAFVYVDENGLENILDEASATIAEGIANSSGETAISWPDNTGLLLRVDPNHILTEHPYEGLLSWILTDAP